jgi:oligopeptidase B
MNDITTKAPLADRRPQSFTLHGTTLTDDYAWLKADNWQEVLHDPSVLPADIRAYLDAENAYTESVLGGTNSLQRHLVGEMRGRIKEDDSSVPSKDGPFAYFRKYREGGQHAIFVRTPRDGGKEETILDGDALAKDTDYFNFGDASHCWDLTL